MNRGVILLACVMAAFVSAAIRGSVPFLHLSGVGGVIISGEGVSPWVNSSFAENGADKRWRISLPSAALGALLGIIGFLSRRPVSALFACGLLSAFVYLVFLNQLSIFWSLKDLLRLNYLYLLQMTIAGALAGAIGGLFAKATKRVGNSLQTKAAAPSQ